MHIQVTALGQMAKSSSAREGQSGGRCADNGEVQSMRIPLHSRPLSVGTSSSSRSYGLSREG